MTIAGNELAWLHCNQCHRAFDHHNRLSERRLIKSDLHFTFCSCGHVYCDHCVALHTNQQGLTCPQCQEQVQPCRLDSTIPRGLEIYLKAPSLEDAQAVMAFQLGNANQLIKALRAKISSQRDLLAKARHELVDHKAMKQRLAETQAENERLKERIRQFTRDTSVESHPPHPPHHHHPHHHHHHPQQLPGRLSLRSPILSASKSPSLSRLHNVLEMPVYTQGQGHYYGGGQVPTGFNQEMGGGRFFPNQPPSHNTPTHSGFYAASPKQPQPRRSNYFLRQ